MKTLHPLGAARLAFLADGAQQQRRGGIPQELLGEERLPEVDGPLLWLVWELVRVDRSLDEEEERLLFLLVTALFVNQRRGSTRLPLRGSAWEALFSSLQGTAADRERILPLLKALQERGSSLVGDPEGEAPLVFDGEHLFLRKIHLLEGRLGARLRDRLLAAEEALEAGPVGAEGTAPAASAGGAAGAAGSAAGSPAGPVSDAGGAAGSDAAAQLLSLRERPPTYGGKSIQLTKEQEEAVRRAVSLPLTVISGGPGTGKTSIVVSILRTLVRMGVSPGAIALAAPTGKAAHRMEASIVTALRAIPSPSEADLALLAAEPKPRTLHRLLGYSPGSGRFRHHEDNPLAAEVVIVDEASMIDIVLMDRLLRSLGAETKLVLLGDADQLPSVDAGAVLRDLVPTAGEGDARRAAVVQLQESFRMDPKDPAGRAILLAAKRINEGDVGGLFGSEGVIERPHARDVTFEKVERLPATERRAFLERWREERIGGSRGFAEAIRKEWVRGPEGFEDEEELRALFAHLEGMRILCVTRVESKGAGADAVNERLHRAHLSHFGLEPSLRFAPGEPVMVLQNDYGRGLFNGDQGVVLRVRAHDRRRHQFQVVFPRGEGFVAFPLDSLAGVITHGWAMTVHKSQGSEFDSVALLLPDEDMPLLTREILYTALTRSRRSVVLVGSLEVLEAAVRRRLERHTGITRLLD